MICVENRIIKDVFLTADRYQHFARISHGFGQVSDHARQYLLSEHGWDRAAVLWTALLSASSWLWLFADHAAHLANGQHAADQIFHNIHRMHTS